MFKGNAIIGQSGGPTAVINSSLVGIVEAARSFDGISNVLGMRFAIEGFMAGKVLDLSKESPEVLARLKTTPSSALGSSRHKLREPDLPVIFELLKKYDIRYLFMIGGNDTMDTIHRVETYARQKGYDLIGIGIPKTVDNDLFGTDHTPGFPSAARYVAVSVLQAGLLARDMQKVDQFVVYQSVGRSAGWLAAASALCKKSPADPPHILCLPERPFEPQSFLANVKRCYDEYGWVSIVCGEGISYQDGTPVSASRIKDKFQNVEFGAMGGTSAAMALHRMIMDEFGFRGEFQVPESLAMCASDRCVPLDIDEAYMCGRTAIELARQGVTGRMVTLVRKSGAPYSCGTGTAELSEVAIKAKPMPADYLTQDGYFVTQAFLDYARPLVGSLPEYGNLSYINFNPAWSASS
jgi:6-phosphofructokinase 1